MVLQGHHTNERGLLPISQHWPEHCLVTDKRKIDPPGGKKPSS